LKSIERLWLPDAAAAQPAQPAPSPLIERFLVKDAADKAHEEKVRLFFRIARALLHDDDDENAALPESVTAMLEHVDSRVQDSKQSDVFRSYCLDILGDDEMDPIFARATALFRCGFCSSKFTYPDIANHLVEMHGAGPVTAYAHVPAPAFRRAVKDLLVEMKLPFTTTSSDLAEYRFDVDEESESDVATTLCDQSWAEVASLPSLSSRAALTLTIGSPRSSQAKRNATCPASGADETSTAKRPSAPLLQFVRTPSRRRITSRCHEDDRMTTLRAQRLKMRRKIACSVMSIGTL
jgi:hypothetical protein